MNTRPTVVEYMYEVFCFLWRPNCGLKGGHPTATIGCLVQFSTVGRRLRVSPFLRCRAKGTGPINKITSNFMQEQKKKYSKGLKWFVFLSVFFLVVVIGLTSGSDDKSGQSTAVQSEQTAPTVENKEQSQEALDALIAISKQAGVVSSYEFSETANVVYVTDAWYDLDVSFKKDLLGKIASLKEAATGYHRFEVRNVKSNEKVAEVTAFSGSVEIYK